jgi:prepilin-type N-terminal cleavage/methylation domain-containing protein/prepilin-type processing-associated H-X9-DG protein
MSRLPDRPCKGLRTHRTRPSSPVPHSSRPAFTLIELLVVIAIVSVLAAILFPVFARARESARAAKCGSNLRQIGMAAQMYFEDWDDRLYFHHAGLEEITWASRLQPYTRNQGIYVCSSDPATALINPNSGEVHRPSYLINAFFTHNFPPGSSEDAEMPVNQYRRDDARMVSPSETILFCESGITEEGHNQDDYDAWNGLHTIEPLFNTLRHNGGTNYAFVDGHARWHRYERVKHMHFPDHQVVP